MHVLKDEKLGVDREYVAVDRNAEVGEKIYTLVDGSDYFGKGEYGFVHSLDGNCVRARFERNYMHHPWLINNKNYHVLEPTDIVHIDGERYRLEDRMAVVGEEIIVTKSSYIPIGHIGVVKGIDVSHDDGSCYLEDAHGGDDYFDGEIDRYLVLTPIQDATEAQESDVINVLANLGAEVAELKRTIARHQAEINALHEDKVHLGEQLANVAADDPKSLAITTDELAQIIVSLSRAGL
ncbi:DUF4407 domain-containing protein [Bacillus altitudinis]|uniref:DUF4407 domain-containing protein n=1 Tax=Bacillus altitudinis TaxID=293387 RepID=UPI0020BE1224|nr:DUF4407 domain-containing protein [Bacillus altitudinis]